MPPSIDEYLAKHDRLVRVNSVEQCLAILVKMSPGYYYRGVSDQSYCFLSSFDRKIDDRSMLPFKPGRICSKNREKLLLEQFKKIAHIHVASELLPKRNVDWLSMMQHYGIPTRLIDFTRSPFIALYFAVTDWSINSDAAVWVISPQSIHQATLHELKSVGFQYPVNEHRYDLWELPDFMEDAYFDEVFMSDNYDVTMLLSPTWANARLSAQQGVFMIKSKYDGIFEDTLSHLIHDQSYMDSRKAEMLDKHGYDMSLMKIVIPANKKRDLCLALHKMNIHGGTLFDGIEGAAKGVAEMGRM